MGRTGPPDSAETAKLIHSRTLRVLGGESAIASKVAPLFEAANPTAAIYCKTGECEIRVTAREATEQAAEAACNARIAEFKEILGAAAYDVDVPALEYTVVRALREHGLHAAAAESCTGGELEARITDIPGASAVLRGGVVVYTNDAKHLLLGIPRDTLEKYGAVSREVAAELAERVRLKLGAQLGVGITGLAGPDGDGRNPVGTVFVSLSDGTRTWVREKHISNRDRATVRLYACQNVFDMLRRYLAGLPVEQERSDI